MTGSLSKSHKNHAPELRDLALAWVTWPRNFTRQFGNQPPAETFKACEAQERLFETINGKEFLESLDRMRLFGAPVFSEEPQSRARKAHEFGLLITRPQGSKSEWRYTELVRKLKKLRETDLRWLLIARWLEGEGVCRAEEFLPKEVLKRLLKRAKKARLRLSASDLQMTRLIRIWLPYFERLLDDQEKLLKKRRGLGEALKELSKMGYLESAVDSIVGKREPVPAVITWLALSSEGTHPTNERTLQNAYSRVEAARERADSKFDKWILKHPHQIDPWEYHNLLHLIS